MAGWRRAVDLARQRYQPGFRFRRDHRLLARSRSVVEGRQRAIRQCPVEALITNRAQESAEADLREVVRHLQTVVEQIGTLGPSVRPFFDARA